MLFGLGAIGLVNEPRGVVYDIVNRQRLRQFKASRTRDEEDAMLAADGARARRSDGVTAAVGTPSRRSQVAAARGART